MASNNTQVNDFLSVLKTTEDKKLKVTTTTVKELEVTPLSFGQQKRLITSGVNGVVGAMVFIKNLNDIIIENTGLKDLKIYDRIPIALSLRKELKVENIKVDEVEIDLNDLIKEIKPYKVPKKLPIVEGDGFTIELKIPTLTEENYFLKLCIDDLRASNNDDIGKNLSTILTYEVPKFIESFKFGENEIKMAEVGLSDRREIIDNLPATITNQITEFILKVRDYDEKLLTIDGVTVDIDSSFFE